jgi:hypothetical protein
VIKELALRRLVFSGVEWFAKRSERDIAKGSMSKLEPLRREETAL